MKKCQADDAPCFPIQPEKDMVGQFHACCGFVFTEEYLQHIHIFIIYQADILSVRSLYFCLMQFEITHISLQQSDFLIIIYIFAIIIRAYN